MLIRDWNSDVCSSDLGNNSSAREITLTPYTPPNLQVTALAAPERAVRGQKFHLEYTVTNAGGATPSLQGRWDDLIYLSRDPFLDLTRSEEHTSELQSLMRISYAVFCLKKKTQKHN